MSVLRRSLIIQFCSSNGVMVANFVVSLILARILSPADIGIYSITVVVANIAHIFRDFGVSSYLRAVKDCTPEAIRAANGVLMTASWSLGLFLFFLSGFVADYYAQPGIRAVMQVLAIGFAFIPFGATTLSLLAREFNAEAAAWINLWGTSAYALTALTLAYLDFGYMSMAWANLVNILATALAAAPFRPKAAPWWPSFKGWHKVVHFGTGSILGNSVGAVNQALPDVILGKMSGPYDVGLLSRANSTTNIFIQIAGPTVNYAALPHLAQIHHRGESLSPTICKASAYLTSVGWPALLATALFSQEVISVLYGPTWLASAPIVEILCLMGALNMLVSFDGAGLMATGRPYLASLPESTLLLARLLGITLCYDGSLTSFAWGLVVAELVNFPVHRYLQHRLGVNLLHLAQALLPSLITVGLCAGASLALKYLMPSDWHPAWRLCLVALTLFPVWLMALRWTRHPFREELQSIFQSLKQRLQRRKQNAPND